MAHGQSSVDLPFDPAGSGLARATAWMLERIAAGDLCEAHVTDPSCWRLTQPVDVVLTMFANVRRPIAAVLSYEEVRPDLARVSVLDERGRDMVVRVWMDPSHPGVPSRFSQVPARGGYTVRPAVAEDGPALAWLEAQVPVERADGSTVTYRRPDAMAQLRLMGDVAPLVAEHDGAIVGCHVDAFHDIHVGGTTTQAMYRMHTRVLPDHQGAGLYPTMTGVQLERFRGDEPFPPFHVFAAAGNTKVGRYQYWETTVERLVIDCATVAARAGSAGIRRATADDAEAIGAILDETHAGRVLYVEPATTWLPQRFGRSPIDYGWADLLRTEGAVAGVWDAGWRVSVHHPSGAIDDARIATLVDWGALAGSEHDLEVLVRQHCADLDAGGVTHLVAFADRRRRAGQVICSLAGASTTFRHACNLPEPADTGTCGIYVDPIFF